MPGRPTVSAIIPTFNGAAHLAEAITSVLAQSRPVDEVIVVDDGSEDATPPVLAGFGDRIRVVRQENRGGDAARNHGVAVASGEVLVFLDHDDVATPIRVAAQLAALSREPRAAAAFGHVVQFVSPEVAPGQVPAPVGGAEPTPGHINSTLTVPRSTFETVGPFAELPDSTGFIDWYARLLDTGAIVTTVPEVILHRRLHPGNLGRRHESASQTYARAMRRVIDRRSGRLPAGRAR